MINILSVIKGVCLQFNSPTWDYFYFGSRMRIMEIFIFEVFSPLFLAILATFAGDVFLEAVCAVPQIGLCCLWLRAMASGIWSQMGGISFSSASSNCPPQLFSLFLWLTYSVHRQLYPLRVRMENVQQRHHFLTGLGCLQWPCTGRFSARSALPSEQLMQPVPSCSSSSRAAERKGTSCVDLVNGVRKASGSQPLCFWTAAPALPVGARGCGTFGGEELRGGCSPRNNWPVLNPLPMSFSEEGS